MIPTRSMPVPVRRYLVHGRVQGVGFRAFVARQIERTAVTGWIRNVGRTTVEAVASGTLEELALLERALRTGPINARVDRFEVHDTQDTPGDHGFTIARSVKE